MPAFLSTSFLSPAALSGGYIGGASTPVVPVAAVSVTDANPLPNFNVDGAIDADMSATTGATSFSLTWGDGASVPAQGTPVVASHTYAEGEYTIQATATAGQAISIASQDITIEATGQQGYLGILPAPDPQSLQYITARRIKRTYRIQPHAAND